MKRPCSFVVVVGVLLLTLPSLRALAEAAQEEAGPRISRLDNGRIRVGVNLDLGGVITELAESDPDAPNLINSHDYGRQVQQSYYSGPQPFGKAHPNWANWPWNPIGTGDVYNHPATVLEHSNDGTTLHTKSVPMQWALENVPGDCTFETWITLDGPTARVRCRLNNAREDRTVYPAYNQELPAVYSVGTLHRLVTYQGTRPFTGEPVATIANAGPPWAGWTASEHWAALVNDAGEGIGVIHPGVYNFIGGFHGTPGQGGPRDNPTGYIAPVRQEILDHDIVYEYAYVLMIGTVDQIREQALALRPVEERPHFVLEGDRQHWTYHNLADAGFPPRGGLLVRATGPEPFARVPERWYEAAEVPTLYLRAASLGTAGGEPVRASLGWRRVDQNEFTAGQAVEVAIPASGGQASVIPIRLADHPGYRGTIAELRLALELEVAGDGDANEAPAVRLEALSWSPEMPVPAGNSEE